MKEINFKMEYRVQEIVEFLKGAFELREKKVKYDCVLNKILIFFSYSKKGDYKNEIQKRLLYITEGSYLN